MAVLRFTSFGSARAAVQYFVDRGADCARLDPAGAERGSAEPAAGRAVDYYRESGRSVGRWAGSGAAALGLSGPITTGQVPVLERLLSGQLPDGTSVARPVWRPHPHGRLPAAALVDAVHAAADVRGVRVDQLLTDDQVRGGFARLSGRVERDPAAAVPPGQLAEVAAAAGIDLTALYGPGRLAVAVAQAGSKVDARRAGVDGPLSAPKSVSVLWALADSRTGEQILAAHRTAVTEAVRYLERWGSHALRGHQGDGRRATRIGTAGLIVAAFEHHTSRADDPQLHTHLVIANLLHGTDGRWSALDTRALFRIQRSAGYLYQAVLRGELTARLGVAWGPLRHGTAEISGLPAGVLREFSQRRRAIETELARNGAAGVRAAQVACLATRPDKTGRPVADLLGEWWQRAQAHLADPAAAVAGVLHRQPAARLAEVDLPAVAGVLLGPAGVTARQSSFDRGELTRALLEHLPAGTSLDQAAVDDVVDRLLGDARVLPLLDPAATRRYTTREHAGTELATLHHAVRRTAVPPTEVPPARLAGLSAEQAAVVTAVAGSAATVDVVLGPAGAGKTALLAALHRHYRDHGVPVLGGCVAAIAARRLQTATAIPASSLARLTGQLRRGEPLPAGCVLVVDEAGMVGTRDYHQLLTAVVAAGGKLVAVGDRAQLTEIDAGGMFARLSRLQLRGELTDNHRQTNGWERDALSALRRGDVNAALRAYTRHGRLHRHPDAGALRDTIAEQYLAALDDGSDPFQVVALAGSRADAAALNTAIRHRLQTHGRLGGDRPVGGGVLAVGELVLVTRNDHRRGLLNGTRGVVTAITDRGVTLRLDDQRHVTVPAGWAADRLRTAYAMTVHKAQGLTVDTALVDTTGVTDRNAAYVAASRARHRTELHHTDTDQLVHTLRDDPFSPTKHSTAEAPGRLAQQLRRHRQQRLAVDQSPRWPASSSPGRATSARHRYDGDRARRRDVGLSR